MQEQFSQSIKNLLAKLLMWFDSFIISLPNVLLAMLVFFITYYLSSRISNRVKKGLNNRIKQSSIRNLIGTFISVAIITLGIILALGILDLDKALNSLITGAGVAGIAIGLALQGTLANTFAGISLSIKNDIDIGDYIESNSFAGFVEDINLRDTKLRSKDNNLVVIPNNLLSSNPYKNYSLTKELRVVIESGVGYESDLRKVEKKTTEFLKKHFPYRSEEIEFNYISFGDSAINFQIRIWIKATEKLTLIRAKSEAIVLLKEMFDRESITIPYPITTVLSEQIK